jgi:neutral ceramidase
MGRLTGGGRGPVWAAVAACGFVVLPVSAAAEPPSGPSAFASAKRGPPHVRVVVKKQSRAQLARTRALRLRVTSRGPGTVRISTTHANAPGERRPRVRTAGLKVLRYQRKGTKRPKLRLTGAGRQLIASCRRTFIRIAVRSLPPRTGSARRKARRSAHTRHGMRPLNFQTPLCPEQDVVADTRFPDHRPPGGGNQPGGGQGGGGSNLRAGAASSDITPPIGTPMFAYTARSRLVPEPDDPFRAMQIVADPDENLYAKSFEPSDGIHTRVLARALVVERRDEKFALVQADLGGVPYALTQEVAKRVEGRGIPAERLMLSATHTHGSTGPIWPADSPGYAALGGDFFDPRIFELTVRGVVEAIVKADENLEPARLGVGTAELRGASRNRRYEPYLENPEAKALPPDQQQANSIDPQVTVIRADALAGGPIGIWTNFAVHPTSLGDDNLLFSGDNPATAERLAEAQIAEEAGRQGLAPPPDRPMVNVWTNSNQGDISPDGGTRNPDGEPLEYEGSGYASANRAGARVAEGTLRAWRDAGTRMSRDMEIGARRTVFAHDGTRADGRPVGPHPVLGQGGVRPDPPKEFPQPPSCSPSDSDPVHGRKLFFAGGPGLVPQHSPVALWRFGSVGISALPLEVTKTMGARIRESLRQASGGALDQVVLAGLSNGYQSYNATPEEYQTCRYEGSFTLFGVHQGYRYRDVSASLVEPLLTGGPGPGFVDPPPTGIGSEPAPKARSTPSAGEQVEDPPASVSRLGAATFRWEGGDPNVDAPRNATFVRLQRQVAGDWVTVGTDDGYFDTTAREANTDVWREVWQFGHCDPLGTYRFHVTGVANTDGDSEREPYTSTSRSFELRRTAPLQVIDATVAGGTARVRARYPEPASVQPAPQYPVMGALISLPRRVSTGTATLRVGGQDVVAHPTPDGLAFEAAVPPGSTIDSVSVTDGCGNSGP